MRIAFNTSMSSYITNLNNLQNKVNTDQTKESTGNNILTLSDDPKNLVTSKQLTNLISRNKQYINNIDTSLKEMQDSSDTMTSMTDKLSQILTEAINGTQTESGADLTTIAGTIKGYLQDLVNDANSSYNGVYIYSGTKTTADSLSSSSTSTNTTPFELVTDTSDSTNYSQLKVVFNGNNEDRLINKDSNSTESINAKAENMFGSNNELFSSIINIYNTLAYNSTGAARTSADTLTSDEVSKIDTYQTTIQNYSDKIDNEASRIGAKINRLTAISSQTTEENTKLNSFLSAASDTDYAQTSLDLAKDQTALQYSLKVGSYLNSTSLFDFLS